MKHTISTDDREFLRAFGTCEYPAAQFNHREHIRLAYILIVEHGREAAVAQMERLLLNFLAHNGVDPAKYHVTLTKAWIQAVAHFMDRDAARADSSSFVDANSRLLDKDIMLTHYSRERLFSESARREFVTPDLDPIP